MKSTCATEDDKFTDRSSVRPPYLHNRCHRHRPIVPGYSGCSDTGTGLLYMLNTNAQDI